MQENKRFDPSIMPLLLSKENFIKVLDVILIVLSLVLINVPNNVLLCNNCCVSRLVIHVIHEIALGHE